MFKITELKYSPNGDEDMKGSDHWMEISIEMEVDKEDDHLFYQCLQLSKGESIARNLDDQIVTIHDTDPLCLKKVSDGVHTFTFNSFIIKGPATLGILEELKQFKETGELPYMQNSSHQVLDFIRCLDILWD